MLFDGDDKTLPRELLAQLKEKAQEVSKVLKETRDANRRLTEELATAKEEADQLREYMNRYEEERQELKSLVDELLKEFEQV